MQLFREIAPLRRWLRTIQDAGVRVGLVPTMGALHAGHLSLVEAVKRRTDVAVVSIFVNPTQFGPKEDLSRYPRDLEGDQAKLATAGADVVFAPDVAEIYPAGFQTRVEVTEVSRGLCGDVRPGHFEGVATVVLKLLSIVRPDAAIFGEKDLQQLAVIRAMARDLCLDVEVLGAPLVRDPDGLAMSSRNAFLSAEDRARALSLSRGLFAAREAYEAGERSGPALVARARRELERAAVVPEYLELRSFDRLHPLVSAEEPAVLLVAARLGSTRLIDNLILRRA